MADPPLLLGVLNVNFTAPFIGVTAVTVGAVGTIKHTSVPHGLVAVGFNVEHKLGSTSVSAGVPSTQSTVCVCTPPPHAAEHSPNPLSFHSHACVAHASDAIGGVSRQRLSATCPPAVSLHCTVLDRTPPLHGCEQLPNESFHHTHAAVAQARVEISLSASTQLLSGAVPPSEVTHWTDRV